MKDCFLDMKLQVLTWKASLQNGGAMRDQIRRVGTEDRHHLDPRGARDFSISNFKYRVQFSDKR